MTYREKRLAVIVGGGLSLLAVWQTVTWVAIDPVRSLRTQIDAAVERRIKLENEAARVAMETRAWQNRTARTLHARSADARRIFRTEIDQLAQAHGLKDNLRVSDGMRQVDKAGLESLPVTVRCSGNARAVMGFLVDFYKLNYLARITGVSLNAEQMAAPRGERGAAPEPKLAVTINAAALVLPPLKDVKGERHGDYANVEPVRRLARDEAEYAKLLERNIFTKWTPKPVVKVEPPSKPERVTRSGPPPEERTRDVPTVDPRRDADKFKIVMSEALRNVAYVAVQDERKLEEAPAEYRVDAEVDGGTVVLIQPRGMVVRVQEDQDGSSQTVYYFYELGKTFKDRTPITPESHPDLATTLNLTSAS